MFPVSMMCSMLGISRSGFYAWRRRKPSKRARETVRLKAEIRAVHKEADGTYGSPRIHAELREREFRVGRNRVARLMREEGLTARFKRSFRRTTDSRHDKPIVDNSLARRFEVEAPNRVWATDITYLRTRQGWLYLAVVLDLFSRRVVGWSMANHLRTELVLGALEMALGQRAVDGSLLHHSDRGCQYASSAYREALSKAGIECSMSRKGDCWDNAVVESFFGTLKTELVHRRTWSTHLEARTAVFEYIEVFYNRKRRHSYLGYVSPADYEHQYVREKPEPSMPVEKAVESPEALAAGRSETSPPLTPTQKTKDKLNRRMAQGTPCVHESQTW